MFLILLRRLKIAHYSHLAEEDRSRQLEMDISEKMERLGQLDQEAWSLTIEIADRKAEAQNLKIAIAGYQAQRDEIIHSIQDYEIQARTATDAIYEKNLTHMQVRLDESAQQISESFQQAEEDYKLEYLQVLEDLTASMAVQTKEKKEKLAQLMQDLADCGAKVAAAVEASKRAVEIAEQANFYKLNIPESDLTEVAKLREIIPYLRDPEALNKVIWKVYYEKPTSDLIGRVIGTEKKTGIYKITNLLDQKCYVGQCVDAASRWRQHIKRGLGAEPVTRNKLYPAMWATGVENFTFELIEECEASELDAKEDFWQEYFHAKDFGYSIK